MRQNHTLLHKTFIAFSLALTLLLYSAPAILAASASISHAYDAGKGIVAGGLVSLDPAKSNRVLLSNIDNGDRLVGVAVGNTDSLVAIDSADTTLQVAITGTVPALVSTLNGPIRVGDQIGVSPFSGLGMKAAIGTRVIGLALENLDAGSSGLVSRTVNDKDGKSQTIQVKLMQVTIAIGPAPQPSSDKKANFLSKLAKSLTGKDVSTPRIIISTIIAVIAVIALVALLYSTLYATIIAIGRNPLAKSAIFRALAIVIAMALFTGFIAVLSIYLLLR